MLKLLLLSPEKLSLLKFTISDDKSYYVQATDQQKARRALPEEIIRQLFLLSLLHDYKYPEDRIRLEWPIQMGRTKKRADIVVLNEDGSVLIVLEIKVEIDPHSMDQLKSYMQMEGAKYGALISASTMECIEMRATKDVVKIRDMPLFDPSQSPLRLTNSSLIDVLTPPDLVSTSTSGDESKQVENEIQIFPLQQLIGLEKFERLSKLQVNITIKGNTLTLPIGEIDSYTKLRRRFVKVGVVLNPKVKEADWYDLFSHLLDSNSEPVNTVRDISNGMETTESEVRTAIASHRVGFCGGWIGSHELDKFLRERNLDRYATRNKRRDMMTTLGYTIHPSLPNGRICNPLKDSVPPAKPVLYLKTDHMAMGISKPSLILEAYLEAQKAGECKLAEA